jgi:hypothetical protein
MQTGECYTGSAAGDEGKALWGGGSRALWRVRWEAVHGGNTGVQAELSEVRFR